MKFYFHVTLLLFVSLLLTSFSMVSAMDIYVSPSGNDMNKASAEQPVKTLPMALRIAREARRLQDPAIQGGIQIHLAAGIYFPGEPVWIRPEDSGSNESPTTILSEGNAVISGSMQIRNWKVKGKLWVADIPDFEGCTSNFRQVWVNGTKAVRARDLDDFEKMERIRSIDKKNEILWVSASAVAKIRDVRHAEMILHNMWAISNLRIKSIELAGDSAGIRFHSPESKLQFERPWPSTMTQPGLKSPFYLTNHPALLDEPGEWYYDLDDRKLYYSPRAGETPGNTIADVPVMENLLNIEGTADRTVNHIQFKNIQFSHTTWLRPSVKGHVPLQSGLFMVDAYKLRPSIDRVNNHKLDNQGWLGRQEAAVKVNFAGNLLFDNCKFIHLGSSGLDMHLGCNNSDITSCTFEDIGGNGIMAGSFSPTALETHLPYIPADERDLTHDITIEDNLIHNVSNDDWGCVGIGAGYVNNVRILYNEISEVSYIGISLGWGWNRDLATMKNNLVKGNLIHHYARHMYDVAGIYTQGAQPGTMIIENNIHSIYHPTYVHDPNHWFYVYTDEGSSFITVQNNWTEGEKFLQNAIGPGNIWENNGPQVDAKIRNSAGRIK